MRILAIDASTKSTGVAIFEDKELITYDCLTASSKDLVVRISSIIKQLNIFINNNLSIDKIIMEEALPVSETNTKTHKALMYLQAAISFLVHENYPSISIEYIYPSSWRSKCNIQTGRGVTRSTLKDADMRFVLDNYNIEANDDICDAIGIGHSYWITNESMELNWT